MKLRHPSKKVMKLRLKAPPDNFESEHEVHLAEEKKKKVEIKVVP